jgi:glycosyltransferase involved in cell wall biosynthesis
MGIRICSVDEEGRFGGPERRITQIASAAAALGIDTHVVYPKYDSDRFTRELARAEVHATALGITRLSAEKRILARYVGLFPAEVGRLCAFFRRERFHLVQANGSQQFKGALAAAMARVPLIWVLEDALMHEGVRAICKRAASRLASGIIVAGKRVYDYYVRGTPLERKPIAEIHPHVDTSLFDPECTTTDRRLDGVPGRKVVTVTGINPTKGLETFIEMAAVIAPRFHDVSFHIAGAKYTSQERYFRSLERMVAEKVPPGRLSFVGSVEDVPPFLKAADVFVFSSNSESGPMAVWEAMSMGKPVVTTDVGSVREYIEDGESGFIVPVKAPIELARRVEFLLENPELARRLGTAAQAIARKRLDVKAAAEKYAAFYRTIAGRWGDV